MSVARVAVLGTGLMGAPMARNLLAAGHEVHVWNRTIEKAQALQSDGAIVHEKPGDAARSADVLILMLTDGNAVADLLFGSGVSKKLAPQSIVVDMSSIKSAEAKDHAIKLEELGIAYLDAPVSGGTKGAIDGTLAIMVGGDEGVFERAEPVLAAMGRPVRVGPTGSGQLAKLANQAIVGITIGAVSEAMLLLVRGGADPAAVREALKGGFADSTILQQHGERMTSGNYEPGGKSSVQLKDLNNALEEAANVQLTLPLTEEVRERYIKLCYEMGEGEKDHSALYLELSKLNEN